MGDVPVIIKENDSVCQILDKVVCISFCVYINVLGKMGRPNSIVVNGLECNIIINKLKLVAPLCSL